MENIKSLEAKHASVAKMRCTAARETNDVCPIKNPLNTTVNITAIWCRGVKGGTQLGPHYSERCKPLGRPFKKVPVWLEYIKHGDHTQMNKSDNISIAMTLPNRSEECNYIQKFDSTWFTNRFKQKSIHIDCSTFFRKQNDSLAIFYLDSDKLIMWLVTLLTH